MRKEKTITTLYVEREILLHAKNNPRIRSLSEWFTEAYKLEFMALEKKAAELEEAARCVERIKGEIAVLKNQERVEILSEKEKKWLVFDALPRYRRISTGRATLEGVYQTFLNEFNRNDITRRQFRIMMDNFIRGIG